MNPPTHKSSGIVPNAIRICMDKLDKLAKGLIDRVVNNTLSEELETLSEETGMDTRDIVNRIREINDPEFTEALATQRSKYI